MLIYFLKKDSHHISLKNIQKTNLEMLQILSNSFKNSKEVINLEQIYFFSFEYCQFVALDSLFVENNILESAFIHKYIFHC